MTNTEVTIKLKWWTKVLAWLAWWTLLVGLERLACRLMSFAFERGAYVVSGRPPDRQSILTWPRYWVVCLAVAADDFWTAVKGLVDR